MFSIPVSFMGEIELNSNLKSTHSIQMELFLFCRYVNTEWRAVDMPSSFDLFILIAYRLGSRLDVLDVPVSQSTSSEWW